MRNNIYEFPNVTELGDWLSSHLEYDFKDYSDNPVKKIFKAADGSFIVWVIEER